MAKARLVSVHFRPNALCPSLFRALGLGRRRLGAGTSLSLSLSAGSEQEAPRRQSRRTSMGECRLDNDLRGRRRAEQTGV